ncbi:MAG: sodium:calcium antiporter [Candidatus Diapherotrites archaeon]|uniref:Sodium:calcium antiporter n=1 Tax=Candidatus Iainarchaeum sp. TaxID=3101447 RepID=A0A8T4L6X7_9ARCH|nr:sodium:calcium antiporter [Candidatus Diapherotrites archaeon]
MVFVELGVIFLAFLVLSETARRMIRRLVNLSRHFGLSEFSISFLVVGGVSIIPELVIGLESALSQSSQLGLGIVFGSNVADLSLVLGLVALSSASLRLHKETAGLIRMMFLAVLLPVLLLLDGEISRFDGVILVGAFLLYVWFVLHSTGSKLHGEKKISSEVWSDVLAVLFLLLIILLMGGVISETANGLSVALALPVFFVGTIVAIGTCLPELSLALESARSEHAELGFGDVFGNVVADCLLTIGLIAIVSPIRLVQPVLGIVTGTWMVLMLLLVALLFSSRTQIGKKEGAGLVLLYVIFLVVELFFEEWVNAGMGPLF